MVERAKKEVFSRIPMRTWRWLGVNDAIMPDGLVSKPELKEIHVAAGDSQSIVLKYEEGGAHELHINLAERAKFSIVNAQLAPSDSAFTCRIKVTVAKDASLSYTGIEAGSGQSATELDVDLQEENARADIWSLYFADDDETRDLNYIIRQRGRRTQANMQVRGALAGHAQKIFRGTLDFLEGARGSVGRENEEVMLLSPNVRNRSVPIMLSHEDDVDGHHAVSVGKMDEGRLFYLMSRGLDLPEAQKLVIEAAFHPVLNRISDTALKDEISAYLMRRLENG